MKQVLTAHWRKLVKKLAGTYAPWVLALIAAASLLAGCAHLDGIHAGCVKSPDGTFACSGEIEGM